MSVSHFKFKSSDRENMLHGVLWMPEGEPVGVVQIVHGMVEYVERYGEFAEHLNRLGFIVVGHDHLGHGSSVKDKEDYGYICRRKPDVALVRDIHILRRIISRKYPELPYMMLGHSMGSYLLRRYLTKYGEGLKGVIISGTGLESRAAIVPALFMIEIMALVKGWHYRSDFIKELTFSKHYRQYDLTGADHKNSWLSRDEAMVEKYYSDERCTFSFTINGYKALLRTVYHVCSMKSVKKIPRELQVLFVSGTQDPVGKMGESVNKVYDMFCKAGILDVTIKLYDGARHEPLNETNREEVYDYLGKWLCKVVRS